MICYRCGVINRPGRVACVQCLARLDPATATTETIYCADHADTPATGRCMTCGKFVCNNCGGLINNRAIYCIDHAALAMSGVVAPAPRGRGKGAAPAHAIPVTAPAATGEPVEGEPAAVTAEAEPAGDEGAPKKKRWGFGKR